MDIPLQALAPVYDELLLFAAVFFALASVDDLLIDLAYLWLRLSGRLRQAVPARIAAIPQALASRNEDTQHLHPKLQGPVAVFIPAWREDRVIGTTIDHALTAWPQGEVTIYVGCYHNDPATIAVVQQAAVRHGARLRPVIHEVAGPTCKADCLNRVHAAMCADEAHTGHRFRFVVLHDAEDMVDPAALPLLDHAIGTADFVQLPVLALPQRNSRWIGGHYSDEFAEAHGKAMVVRDALGAALPGAGVGCALARDMLARLAVEAPDGQPFGTGSLVEDYELGLNVARLGGRSRFVRVRADDGRLVATRAYFPAHLDAAVRQKTRWTHGIALQGWDRLGWRGGMLDRYMLLRDRRGPFGALLLALAYAMVAATGLNLTLIAAGAAPPMVFGEWLQLLLAANLGFLLWQAAWRAAFTTREFGWREGARAVLRIPVSNIIAIMAVRRALFAYCRSLGGEAPRWDKTEHDRHPAAEAPDRLAA